MRKIKNLIGLVLLTLLLVFTLSNCSKHNPSQWNQDMERQVRIDQYLNHVGLLQHQDGQQTLLQDRDRRLLMTILDQKMVDTELNRLDEKLSKQEVAIIEEELYAEGEEGEREPNVVLLSACDNHSSDIVAMALQNRKEYTHKHSYHHHFVDLNKYTSNESVMWLKIPAIIETFEQYPDAEWIWWLDMDAIIMNMELKLGDHLLKKSILEQKLAYGHPLRNTTTRFEGHVYPDKEDVNLDNIDFIISQDSMGLNAGSFFIRRSYFSDLLLDLWSDPALVSKHWPRQEQDALIYLLLTHKSLLSHVGLVPQRLINSYHDQSFSHVWRYRPGDFVVHFAGVNAERGYSSLWKSYYKMLTPPVSDDDDDIDELHLGSGRHHHREQ